MIILVICNDVVLLVLCFVIYVKHCMSREARQIYIIIFK